MAFCGPEDFFIGDSDVTRLNSLNFCNFITGHDLSLVFFYDPTTYDSEDARWPFLDTIESNTRPNVAFGAINCYKSKATCENAGVIQEPIFRIYAKGQLIHTFPHEWTYSSFDLVDVLENVPVPRGASTPYSSRVL